VRKLYMAFCVLSILAITGVAFFTQNEGWSAVEAFYWTLCTMTVHAKHTFVCLCAHITLILFSFTI
jgi:hypothetical protein